MKNASLYIAGFIFLIISAAQFLRWKLGLIIAVGETQHIPVEVSLYAGIGFVVLAIWMIIAAIKK